MTPEERKLEIQALVIRLNSNILAAHEAGIRLHVRERFLRWKDESVPQVEVTTL